MTEDPVAAAEPKVAPAGEEQGESPKKSPARRRRRSSSSGRSSTRTSTAGQDGPKQDGSKTETAKSSASDDGRTQTKDGEPASGTEEAARRRRRRRGGRGRARSTTTGTASTTTSGDSGTDEASKKQAAESKGDAGSESSAPATRSRPRRRRSGTSTTKTKPAAAEAAPSSKKVSAKEDQSGPTRTRRSRTTTGRRRREPQPLPKRSRDKIMLITERGDRDQIAVVEGRDLIEHYITRVGAHSMVGNIYLGRVQNVLPGMEAAFVDVGRGRNAVLYAGEVAYDEEVEGQPKRIEQVLKAGQSVLVQITKDPMGGKGPRLTAEISLPGRFVVLVPNSQVFGLSRRLPEDERKRLRTIVKRIKPPEHGIIVRTAAEGASEEDLTHDIERLVVSWADIEKKAKGKAPKVLYEEPELTVRVVRDLFNDEEFTEIITDSVPVFDSVTAYLRDVAPDLVGNVRLHDGPLPLFEEYHLVEQIHKALERKVWLPSGGYIVIDRTEAMTVIDVNTGRHVGKTNLEETVVKTNIEAAEETARQLRLRDIGGIILIDFIDMLFEQNKGKVVGTLKEALAQDKTRSQVFDISALGLLEVTRKRVSAGLLESFSETCPTCEGRGILITHEI